jgi:adenosylcobinamide kinase/adenosylcobinamide-phosphate guanylyltransferase
MRVNTLRQHHLILIGGGVRCGKSELALTLARRLGRRRLFLATAQGGDDEMRQRIDRHRRTRGDDFHTLEEPLAVSEVLRQAHDHDVVVIDCLTLWLTNLLLDGRNPDSVLRCVAELADVLREKPAHSIIVTNEVGLGLVPESALGRTFRDVAGLAHQHLATVADEVYFGALGMMLRLKPGPIIFAGEVIS